MRHRPPRIPLLLDPFWPRFADTTPAGQIGTAGEWFPVDLDPAMHPLSAEPALALRFRLHSSWCHNMIVPVIHRLMKKLRNPYRPAGAMPCGASETPGGIPPTTPAG